MQKTLVTGCAGFIGSNLTDELLLRGYKVIGIDDFNDYYDPKIKERNLKKALTNKRFRLYRKNILDFCGLEAIFEKEKPDTVIHLAARAGVRPSIDDPKLYADGNVMGTLNLLKLAVDNKIGRFIFGSSSSVYGNSSCVPFNENDNCESIISPYGASKRSAEFFVEAFHKSFGLNCMILRFFTVYGPRSRPDMAPAIFTKAILAGTTIEQFGNGTSSRDYTYIDDVVNGISKALETNLDFEIINLGDSNPVKLSDFIKTIEKIIGKKANIAIVDNQPGDVERTWANINKARRILGWKPDTKLESGMKKYVKLLN